MAKQKVKACSCGSVPVLKENRGIFFFSDETAYMYKCPCCGKVGGICTTEEAARKAWDEEADAE